MTTTERFDRADLRIVSHDLYRDIHKGIRTELFSVTAEAGRIDPHERRTRAGLALRVGEVFDLLVDHAHHEDAALDEPLELHLPVLAERIAGDHAALDRWMAELRDRADSAVDAGAGDRAAQAHRLYIELAAFTSAYLEHQDLEEREVMPALEDAIGVDAVLAIHDAILATMPPEEKARSLALMLPAMNIDNRAEMLAGMRAGAPPEVFEGVWGLAASVLPEADHAALARRLGLG